jgi:hypothetical protein
MRRAGEIRTAEEDAKDAAEQLELEQDERVLAAARDAALKSIGVGGKPSGGSS